MLGSVTESKNPSISVSDTWQNTLLQTSTIFSIIPKLLEMLCKSFSTNTSQLSGKNIEQRKLSAEQQSELRARVAETQGRQGTARGNDFDGIFTCLGCCFICCDVCFRAATGQPDRRY